MFHVITQLRQLDFRRLMEVCRESNLCTSRQQYPNLSQGLGILQAEQDYFQYLSRSFFSEGGFLCVFGQPYLAALRMEPYNDGFLLTALETVPEMRNKGIGKELVRQSLSYCADRFGCPVYSHVAKDNVASMAVHTGCGFRLHKPCAVYLDGSVSYRCNTLIWTNAPV